MGRCTEREGSTTVGIRAALLGIHIGWVMGRWPPGTAAKSLKDGKYIAGTEHHQVCPGMCFTYVGTRKGKFSKLEPGR